MRVFWVAFAILVFGASALEAQQDSTRALHPEDAGYAISRRTLSSGAEFARCIRENDRACLRATPEEVLRSYSEAFPELGLRSVEDLALRAESWIVEPCPRAYVNLARLNLPSRTIDFLFARELRVGEMCFFDTNLGVYVGSAGCGNAFKDKNVGRDQANPSGVRAEVSLTLGQPVKDTFFLAVPRGTRVNLVGNGEHRNIWADTTFTIPRPSAWKFSAVDTTRTAVQVRPQIVREAVTVTDTVVVNNGSGPWPWIIGTAVGAGIGWLAHELLVKHKCKCTKSDDSGGPVDPPNRWAKEPIVVPSLSVAGPQMFSGGVSGGGLLPISRGARRAGWLYNITLVSVRF